MQILQYKGYKLVSELVIGDKFKYLGIVYEVISIFPDRIGCHCIGMSNQPNEFVTNKIVSCRLYCFGKDMKVSLPCVELLSVPKTKSV
jgi:hypothetical protein